MTASSIVGTPLSRVADKSRDMYLPIGGFGCSAYPSQLGVHLTGVKLTFREAAVDDGSPHAQAALLRRQSDAHNAATKVYESEGERLLQILLRLTKFVLLL